MARNNRILFSFFLIVCFGVLNAQEYESGLSFNPALEGKNLFLKSATTDTISLPFFDDFSGRDPYPNSKNWADKNVYINSTYEVEPISTGVATFDALDEAGNVYNIKSASSGADTLTSNPINLIGKDSVYLSFFYQPMGLGNKPESQDSLKLQFKELNDSVWTTQFQVEGSTLKPFQQVILPVETQYLYNGFQFRYINLASLTTDSNYKGYGANSDHWNIDYVYLNEGRNINDTTYHDLTITTPVSDIFKNYETIPWRHYSNAKFIELQPEIPVTVSNLNQGGKPPQINVQYYYQDMYNPEVDFNDEYTNINLPSQTQLIVPGDLTFDFGLSPSKENAKFYIRINLKEYEAENLNKHRKNDTTAKIIEFKDYYAYDDGSPEAGYGFTEISMFAMKFNTYKKDTLKNIYMYFNPTRDSSNNKLPFKLNVWSVLNNEPGQIIWETAVNTNSLSKKFTRYEIDEELILEGEFFIGWQQLKQNYLNIGLDKNNTVTGKAFVNLNGKWEPSSIEGVVMLRPGFGTPVSTSIRNNILKSKPLKLYPNPANEIITVEFENEFNDPDYSVEIIDLLGRTLYRETIETTRQIDVSQLKTGLYLVVLKNKTNILAKQKLLVK